MYIITCIFSITLLHPSPQLSFHKLRTWLIINNHFLYACLSHIHNLLIRLEYVGVCSQLSTLISRCIPLNMYTSDLQCLPERLQPPDRDVELFWKCVPKYANLIFFFFFSFLTGCVFTLSESIINFSFKVVTNLPTKNV